MATEDTSSTAPAGAVDVSPAPVSPGSDEQDSAARDSNTAAASNGDFPDPGTATSGPAAPGSAAPGSAKLEPDLGPANPVRENVVRLDISGLLTARPSPTLDFAFTGYQPAAADLLIDARIRPRLLAPLLPTSILIVLVASYVAATLLWPLSTLSPQFQPTAIGITASAKAELTWPEQGSAAVSVAGMPGPLSSSATPDSIASITKLVTALMVLERLPLEPGEQGPNYTFTSQDREDYWGYRQRGESAVDVPVDGALTEYQMLEGLLIGSANNYANRLARDTWGDNATFAREAQKWLTANHIAGVQIVDPSGIDARNSATPEALIPLAQVALANPVIAEIVVKRTVELPGVGVVENTNGLLEDPGVLGLKTGTLDRANLLSAKDITVGDLTVRAYASVMGQPRTGGRVEASRNLYDQLTQQLKSTVVVEEGTAVGAISTIWGETATATTSEPAQVLLWNGAIGTASSTVSVPPTAPAGAAVGTLTAAGPVNTDTVQVELTKDILGPSPWWRMTHPLELFGVLVTEQ